MVVDNSNFLRGRQATPVGLINTSFGGTRIEPRTAAQHIEGLISRLPEPAAQIVEQAVSDRQVIGPG